MRILMWDVHGGYTDSLLAGPHEYLFLPPEQSGRGGLARYGDSPPSTAYEVSAEELATGFPMSSSCSVSRRLSSALSISADVLDLTCQRFFWSTTPQRPMCPPPGIRLLMSLGYHLCMSPISTSCSGIAAGRPLE